LRRECSAPEHIVALFEGLAKLRQSVQETRRGNYLQLVALEWLMSQLKAGALFPAETLGRAKRAARELFEGRPSVDDVIALVGAAGAGVSSRVEDAQARLYGRVEGRRAWQAVELVRAVMQFGTDRRPIHVFTSSMPVPKRKSRAKAAEHEPPYHGAGLLAVAEGEVLSLSAVICLLQCAYADRPIIPAVAGPERCGARGSIAGIADVVCLGSDLTNAATRTLLHRMSPDNRPKTWIEKRHREGRDHHYISVPDSGREISPQFVKVTGKSGTTRTVCRDGAVIHLRARHGQGEQGKACLLAGITTYGTAFAAGAFADSSFLHYVASTFPEGGPRTLVLRGMSHGLTDMWPASFSTVWPERWPR
jgi:hypothetical protein